MLHSGGPYRIIRPSLRLMPPLVHVGGHCFLVFIVRFIALVYLLWDTIKVDNGGRDSILHSLLVN